MSKLTQALRVRPGDRYGIDEFNGPMQCFTGETGEVRDFISDRNKQWFLEAQLQVTFWANDAQRQDEERYARRALMNYLYSDVLCELANLRMAISDGNRRKANTALDKIDRVLMGETP